MIPSFSVSGVLPPFIGNSPASCATQAPFRTSMSEVVERFALNIDRVVILEGLFEYRAKMRALNINGYQWLDGSFVEDCEKMRNRPPADIDVITFAYRPSDDKGSPLDTQSFSLLADDNPDLFDPEDAKASYKCDAYYVDFNQKPHLLAQTVTYWCNLFSHSRINNLWKGILQVELNVDDSDAKSILELRKQMIIAANAGGENA